MVQLNLEYIFPIFAKAGIKGVLFLDLGNAYLKDETIDFSSLKKSIGAGIRWYSPRARCVWSLATIWIRSPGTQPITGISASGTVFLKDSPGGGPG